MKICYQWRFFDDRNHVLHVVGQDADVAGRVSEYPIGDVLGHVLEEVPPLGQYERQFNGNQPAVQRQRKESALFFGISFII